jgi:hypothetical protein
MTSNFLTYGMSIQDHGLFFEHIPNKSNSDEHIVL